MVEIVTVIFQDIKLIERNAQSNYLILRDLEKDENSVKNERKIENQICQAIQKKNKRKIASKI